MNGKEIKEELRKWAEETKEDLDLGENQTFLFEEVGPEEDSVLQFAIDVAEEEGRKRRYSILTLSEHRLYTAIEDTTLDFIKRLVRRMVDLKLEEIESKRKIS